VVINRLPAPYPHLPTGSAATRAVLVPDAVLNYSRLRPRAIVGQLLPATLIGALVALAMESRSKY